MMAIMVRDGMGFLYCVYLGVVVMLYGVIVSLALGMRAAALKLRCLESSKWQSKYSWRTLQFQDHVTQL